MTVLFLHGVPDTPQMWQPLIQALSLDENAYVTPSLPGFASPRPSGFAATKEAYLDWLTGVVDEEVSRTGPVDLVGHDWGSALCLRLAHLRPELVRSWTAVNAVLEPTYRWHSTARIWQTPILGEIFMAMARPSRLAAMLTEAGMPAEIARIEAEHVDPDMKKSILKLYRSARKMSQEWATDLSGLSRRGLVIWGDADPFVSVALARKFCADNDIPLHEETGAGHWAICERPDTIAERLKEHWRG